MSVYTITAHHAPKPVGRALAPRYSTVEAAFADMRDGCVWEGERLVAFHERHLAWLQHAHK